MFELLGTRGCHLILISMLLALPGGPVLSQQTGGNHKNPPACWQFAKMKVPEADLPTEQDRKTLASCDSEKLYFGFDQPARPEDARRCAYLERERGEGLPQKVFGAAGLLTMIYANGKGAARNFDLALKFACEVDGAPAENEARFDHLLKLKEEHWTGDDFNLCDDATSGLMQGWCADLRENFDQVVRTKRLKNVTEKWNGADKKAFLKLQQAASAFFGARAENEVDLTGTGRAAWEIEARATLEDNFAAALEKLDRGELPDFSAEEFTKADAELNRVYSEIQREKTDSKVSTASVTPEKIRIAQLAWLRYREAWVKFGKLKYPGISPNSWRTWLTLERIKMLQALN